MSTKKKYYTKADLEKQSGRLSVGEFLRSWRLCDELSQKDFAKKLGISAANLCDIEKGRKGISPSRAFKIAKKIGYPAAVLVQMALQDQVDMAKLKLTVSVAA